MKTSNYLLLVFFIMTFSSCQLRQPVVILISEESSSVEMLSAKEIRRYIYHRTKVLPEIIRGDKMPGSIKNFIVVANKESQLLKDIYPPLAELQGDLKKDGYYLKTVQKEGQKVVIVTGNDEMGVLYGAYAFAEILGVRFYLHGDVIPDKTVKFSLPDLDEKHNPLFELRGVQPFHDFPEGPDWWSLDDYKGLLAQLTKLKMNFIGFHTYPEGSVGPEPLVWIGMKEDIKENGTVEFSYPARHFTTASGTWGYKAKKTEDYFFNAGELFEKNDYGNEYMDGMTPWPENLQENNELFDRTASFFNEVFTYAHELGIKTCVGTETPLVIPEELKIRLKKSGMDT
ncbi:MAG: alpha-glucuronidase family glycosyl hydrolase, partial [Bacteroidales bacterium]